MCYANRRTYLHCSGAGFKVDASRLLHGAGSSFTLTFKAKYAFDRTHNANVWWGPYLFYQPSGFQLKAFSLQKSRQCAAGETECREPMASYQSGCDTTDQPCATPDGVIYDFEAPYGSAGGSSTGTEQEAHPDVKGTGGGPWSGSSFFDHFHFVSVTVSRNSLRIYVDGAFVGKATGSHYKGHAEASWR